MKNASFIFGLLLSTAALTVKGQQPSCQHLIGTWKDGDNRITILSQDSASGEIKGTYHAALTDSNRPAPVLGWISVSPVTEGPGHPTALTWSSGVVPSGDIVSWTGYCRREMGIPTIHALSVRVQQQGDSATGHLITDMTVWVPANAVIAAHPMAVRAARAAPATGIGSANCPYEGLSKNGNPPAQKMVALNLLKNRTSEPEGSDLNSQVTLSDMLNSKDDPNRFDEQQGATITGVLFDVRAEKGESCNCYSTDPNDWDYHIYIGKANAQSIFDCAVVEMTPYSRSIHPEWTLAYVKSLKGKQVQVTGWLLYDFEHKSQSYETNPNPGTKARHTVWEIHPVTSLTEGAN